MKTTGSPVHCIDEPIDRVHLNLYLYERHYALNLSVDADLSRRSWQQTGEQSDLCFASFTTDATFLRHSASCEECVCVRA